MHINDTYALTSVLRDIREGNPVDRETLDALIQAADEEVQQFENMLEEMAAEDQYRRQVEEAV